MADEKLLRQRSDNRCEFCGAENDLQPHEVGYAPASVKDDGILLCATCTEQLAADSLDENHWRCLNDSMWSQQPEVQVMAYRTLTRLVKQGASWAQDLLDMLYLEDETRLWADAGIADDSVQKHVDCNGAELKKGDNVTIIKDLPVKGSSMVVKQGTMVRNINLAQDDPELFSGKVDGQSIWLRCEFSRKK